jgi:hypothetical protein
MIELTRCVKGGLREEPAACRGLRICNGDLPLSLVSPVVAVEHATELDAGRAGPAFVRKLGVSLEKVVDLEVVRAIVAEQKQAVAGFPEVPDGGQERNDFVCILVLGLGR